MRLLTVKVTRDLSVQVQFSQVAQMGDRQPLGGETLGSEATGGWIVHERRISK
jgi:hypothetical protein